LVAPVVASVAPTAAATLSEIPLTGNPGSCLVLEEQYCAEVTFVASGTEVFAVLKAPAGTIVYAPHSGIVAASTAVEFGGVRYPAFLFLFQVSAAPARLEAVRFVVGAPTFHLAALATVRVKTKGQRVGVLTGRTFAALGDYNFAMLTASSQGMDFATMRAWFPGRALPPTPTPLVPTPLVPTP